MCLVEHYVITDHGWKGTNADSIDKYFLMGLHNNLLFEGKHNNNNNNNNNNNSIRRF